MPKQPGPFAEHLQPGERLLWQGRPAEGFRLRLGTVRGLGREETLCLIVGVGLIAAALAALSQGTPIAQGGARALGEALFALAVGALGVALILGPHWLDARARARTRYALTDRRALILRGARLEAHPLPPPDEAQPIPGGVLVARRDRPLSTTALLLGRRMRPGDLIAFEMIDDAPQVLALLRRPRKP